MNKEEFKNWLEAPDNIDHPFEPGEQVWGVIEYSSGFEICWGYLYEYPKDQTYPFRIISNYIDCEVDIIFKTRDEALEYIRGIIND